MAFAETGHTRDAGAPTVRLLKRLLDVVVAAAILVVTLPITLIVAAVVAPFLGRPILTAIGWRLDRLPQNPQRDRVQQARIEQVQKGVRRDAAGTPR
jgi:hypothetical protein